MLPSAVNPHPFSLRPVLTASVLRVIPKLPPSCLKVSLRLASIPWVMMFTVPPMAGNANLLAPSPR